MATIFISYRITDGGMVAPQLEKTLKKAGHKVFWDKKRLKAGDDWKEEIDKGLKEADYVLVLIGHTWTEELLARRERGGEDIVVREINTALKRGVRVIPVKLSNAASHFPPMPAPDQIPNEIAELLSLQHHMLVCEGELDYLDTLKKTAPSEFEGLDWDNFNPASWVSIQPSRQEKLLKMLERLPIYDALQHGMEGAYSQLIEVANKEDFGELHALIQQLKTTQINANEQTFSLFSGDDIVYRNALLKIIEEVGSISYNETTDERKRFIERKLENVFEQACRELALADGKASPPESTTAHDEHVIRQHYHNHGYLGLLRFITKKDGKQGRVSDLETGYRAIAYYREYREPPQILPEEAKGYIKTIWKIDIQEVPDQTRVERQTNVRMVKHTWREFITEEVLGGILMAFLFAIAFSNHTTITQEIMRSQGSIADLGANGWGCWTGEGGAVPVCTLWTFIDGAMLAMMTLLGLATIHSRQFKLSAAWFRAITFGVVALIFFMVVQSNYLGNVDFLTQMKFIGLFIVRLIVAGLLTMPVTTLFLAGMGLASVFINERRVRSHPDIGFAWSMLFCVVGMAGIMFAFGAVNEKSRQDVLQMVILGAIWGVFIGLGIYQGFKITRGIESHEIVVPKIKTRLFITLGVSMLASFSIWLIDVVSADIALWPRQVEFFTLPILYSFGGTLSPVLQESFQWAIGLAEITRVLLIGAWLGLAMHLGIEMLTQKMMKNGNVITIHLKEDERA